MRILFVLLFALTAVPPVAAGRALETKLSVSIDSSGKASATLTVTNHSNQPICFLPKEKIVWLSDASGRSVGPIVANPGHPWPDYMPVVWDDGMPRDFELLLNTEFGDANQTRQATRATYDFEAYDCTTLFADRVHVRPSYKRKLTTTITASP
jgi:hypothetical protein